MSEPIKILKADANGVFSVPCEQGFEVEVLSIVSEVSGVTQGEQVVAAFTTDMDILVQSACAPLPVSADGVSFFTNGATQQPMVDSQTVATGVWNYNTEQVKFTAPLPEVWWPFAVRVQVQATSGATVSKLVLVYRQRKL